MSKDEISQPQSGARDLLARLYREIGISAVAAALESVSARPEVEDTIRSAVVSSIKKLSVHEHDVHKSEDNQEKAA